MPVVVREEVVDLVVQVFAVSTLPPFPEES